MADLDPDDLVILSGKSFERVLGAVENLCTDLPDLRKAAWIEGYTQAVADIVRGTVTWTAERQMDIYAEAERAWDRRPS